MPYRWVSGERKGSWQPTRREAEKAAIGAGVAKKGEGGAVLWIDGGSLEQGDGRRRAEARKKGAED